jgi:hypothetical protein
VLDFVLLMGSMQIGIAYNDNTFEYTQSPRGPCLITGKGVQLKVRVSVCCVGVTAHALARLVRVRSHATQAHR